MDIKKSTQMELLEGAFAVDGKTGNECKEGEAIIDLTNDLSVPGQIINGEIIIDDESIIYNPWS